MGGCVASVMDRRDRSARVDDPILQAARNYGINSVAIPNSATDKGSAIYRNSREGDDAAFQRSVKGITDLPPLLRRLQTTCRERPTEQLVLHRPVDRVVKETHSIGGANKLLDITYLKPTERLTMDELWERIEDFSRGLAELGLNARENISIYEETRWEWIASIYGIWLQDMVASTVYANLGEDALFYALRETECKAIVCNGRSVPNLLRGVAAGRFPPCTIIYLDALPTEGTDGGANPHNCRVVAWTDVVAMGAKAKKTRTVVAPKDNNSIALIMYTSGTTGDPKGVMHSHATFSCGVRVLELYIESILGVPLSKETYCSYLPLAHILEFGVVNVFLVNGATVGFGSPRTLTDMTARPHGDFIEYRPTAMVGVARIYDTLKRAVEAKLPPAGSLKRQVFDRAYQSRLEAIHQGKDTPFYNEKVFKQARAVLGGCMRAMLSGGGPTNELTQEFINVVFGAVVVGWGSTESVCVGAIGRLGDLEPNHTGQVLAGEELRLADTEEYKHTDEPEPRGEICLRGPFLFKGYYKNEVLTKEVLDEEGFFHTGDIGSVSPEGKIRIIGRIKALAKNSLGEYIAMEMLESIYADCPIVLNNNVCVLVHPDKNYICAIAVTEESRAMKFAREHSIANAVYPDVLRDKAFLAAVGESLAAAAAAARRQPFEKIRRVHVVDDNWCPENGILTAALKLRRRAIDERYENEMRELFAD